MLTRFDEKYIKISFLYIRNGFELKMKRLLERGLKFMKSKVRTQESFLQNMKLTLPRTPIHIHRYKQSFRLRQLHTRYGIFCLYLRNHFHKVERQEQERLLSNTLNSCWRKKDSYQVLISEFNNIQPTTRWQIFSFQRIPTL